MSSPKVFFGDIFYLKTDLGTLTAFSPDVPPCFVSSIDSVQTSFRNALFRIFPLSNNNLPKLIQEFSENDIPVKPGNQVIFYHIETKSLLVVSEKDNSTPSKSLTLSKTLSDDSVFVINSHQPTIDEISYDQPIEISSEKLKLFVAAGDLQQEKISLNPSTSYSRTTTDFPKIMPRRNPFEFPGSQYLTTFKETSTEFRLSKYQSNEDLRQNKATIGTGDFVRIRHIDKWLTFYPNQDKKKEIYFEKIDNSFQQKNYIHTIFQVIDESSIQGNSISPNSSKTYILKHFLTGGYVHSDLNGQTLKLNSEIVKNDNESPYFCFETEIESIQVKEKLPLKIKHYKQDIEAYIKPTNALPVKNTQFEINTLYFFGFKIPEEYTYKNLKNLTRYLAELSSIFEHEDCNIVLERVSQEEVENILEIEQFANELQELVDLISITNNAKKQLLENTNKRIISLKSTSQKVLDRLSKKGKFNDEEEKDQATDPTKKYQLQIYNRQIQALIREFRIFDLIHFINFLLIKKSTKHLKGEGEGDVFDLEEFFELYEVFSKVLLSSLHENAANRFYNSQYIRIYIHFMASDSCEGVFHGEKAASFLPRKRKITIQLLKTLLWDEDLDGLGQLNFYQNIIFTTITQNKTFETSSLELLEHISSSKAYNLINSFRDSFITSSLTNPKIFKSVFPIITLRDEEIVVELHRGEEKVVDVLLKDLMNFNQDAYNYFVVAFRVIVALSTSKLVTFYHQFIKHYPLSVLQAVLRDSTINVEIKMLVHLVILYVYCDYIKLPFNFIPPNIQTSNETLRQTLNLEEKKIVSFCKSYIGDFEKTLLNQENISEEVYNNISSLNTQDCSQQIHLLELFIASEITFQKAQVILFYINSSIQNSNGTIHFLNKAKEALIKVRKMFQNSKESELEIIPTLLELFSLVNQKMKAHSTIAIYNQVLKNHNPNAEGYSRQIISGLKKIYLESFSPIEMMALNEPMISSISLKYLKDVAQYESSIADELDKFVILSSMKEVETLMETIDIALTLNQNTRKYYVQKEKESKIVLKGEEFLQNIDLLEKLFTFIYNPAEHFLFSEEKVSGGVQEAEDPVKKFFRILRLQKVVHRDHPFLIQPKAIIKLQQRIFALLSLHDILLKLLNCTITLVVENKPPESPAEVYQARLILMILIAFVYKNKSNQDLLSKSHSFISLYYLQKYIDKSCDALTLFAEVMRDNEELLDMTKKFIYDITSYTFLGTIKPRSIVKDSGAYLCTAIMSMHYLQKADLPSIIYDTFSVAEIKLEEIIKNSFPNLNSLTNIVDKVGQTAAMDLPACYYNIRQMLISLIQIVSTAQREKKFAKIAKFRNNFNFKRFLQGYTKPEFRFQFDIKNLFLKCISKLHFSENNFNANFFKLDTTNSASSLIAYLLNEILEFLLSSQKNFKKEVTEKVYSEFSQMIDKLEEDSTNTEGAEELALKEVQENYKEFSSHNLNSIKQLLFLDELPISTIWEYLYIFESCWTTLAKIFIKYPEIIESTQLLEYFLILSEQLTSITDIHSFKALEKMKKYFGKMESLKQYESLKQKIKDIKELIIGREEGLSQEKDLQENKKQDKIVEEPPEKIILETMIEHLRGSKQKDTENNIQLFSQLIKAQIAKKNIISELLVTIECNPLNLHKDVISLVAQLLKFYLRKIPFDNLVASQNDSSLYEEFCKSQEELMSIQAEKSILQGISIVNNFENLHEIFKLVLVYAGGSNLKVIENLKTHLESLKFDLMWCNRKEKKYESNIECIFEEIKKSTEALNDNELAKFLEYCLKSYRELNNEESDQNNQKLKESKEVQLEILTKQLQSFFQEYANKDQDEVYKELGPLFITTQTLEELFRVHSTDTASLKITKNTILKHLKEKDLEKSILRCLLNEDHRDKESLELMKVKSILLLDIYISKIKYGMLVSE